MTSAVLAPSFPEDRAVVPRFALALAASAFAHLLLVQSLAYEVPERAGRLMHAGTMTVRIIPPVPPPAAAPEPPVFARRAGQDVTGAAGGRPAAPEAIRVHPTRDPVTSPMLPQAPDPTYYSARDLDVYPRPAMPLDFERLGSRGADSGANRFRVVMLIDEAGAVNEISVIDPEPPRRLHEALRAMLAAIRFFPGQKDGRAVKSRVLLSLSLDPAGGEAAGR